MLAKLIGYSIGAVFVALLLAPIPITVWLIYDRAVVLSSTTAHAAVIEECYHEYRTTGNTSRGSWGPVAVTSDGTQVRGDFRWRKKDWCLSDIGDEVTVLLHPYDASKNRINSFMQFWFYPLLMTAICLVFYPLSYRAKKRKDAAKNNQDL